VLHASTEDDEAEMTASIASRIAASQLEVAGSGGHWWSGGAAASRAGTTATGGAGELLPRELGRHPRCGTEVPAPASWRYCFVLCGHESS
jgi:hypothetical protein